MSTTVPDDRYISDWPFSERYPQYTRANAGEVLPDPSSPLNSTLVWHLGVEVGRREGYTDPVCQGTHRPDEIDEEWPEGAGFFGGYHYIGLPITAIIGARMPGMTVETWNQAWIGDRDDIPPQEHRDSDEDPEITQRLIAKGEWALTTTTFPEVEEAKARAKADRESRPDLASVSDQELVDRARVAHRRPRVLLQVALPGDGLQRGRDHDHGPAADEARRDRPARQPDQRHRRRRLGEAVLRDVGARSDRGRLRGRHPGVRGTHPGRPRHAAGQR